ncbi:MAG: DUF115 domain-containing protein [Treponema sp.]|jgi:hypothetical protein|nr:DUF115 domain-containing protein [Treponema sp.]
MLIHGRLIETGRGYSLSYRGKTLLSVMDPAAQAERALGTVSLVNRTLYFCPSPLFGYGLEGFLERLSGESPDSAVLCVEAEEELLELSGNAMKGLLENPRLRLAGAGDPGALCDFVRDAWGSRRFRRVEPLRLSGGWRLHRELYDSLAGVLREDIALEWGNAVTLMKLGRRYMRNAVRNLALVPSCRSLRDLSFGARPVLVLGAGPSLDGLLDCLERRFGESLRDGAPEGSRSFKIMCVDTALPAMRARRIKPDLAVALESQHWNIRDFTGLGDWELPLAMDLSALPETAEMLGSRVHLFFTPWTPLRVFGRLEKAGLLPERLRPLGSVGLAAAAAALRLGSGPVLCGGIDFSFTPDSYHARSTPGHREKLREHNRFQGVLNAGAGFRPGTSAASAKSGAAVRSDAVMRGYRDLFEREFSGTRIIGISGGGLHLGVKTVDAEEACGLLGENAGSAAGEHTDAAAGENAGRAAGKTRAGKKEDLLRFVRGERESLAELRDILTGETAAGAERLDGLLDGLDYLWAHLPGCAGRGGARPPASDIAFLKMVRAEIDPFLKLWKGLAEKLTQRGS